MTVVYKDYMGNVFDTEEECTKSENTSLGILMYNRDGEETFISDDAVYIYCPNDESVELLENNSSNNKFDRDITDSDYCSDSWWKWNEKRNVFEKADQTLVKLIRSARAD